MGRKKSKPLDAETTEPTAAEPNMFAASGSGSDASAEDGVELARSPSYAGGETMQGYFRRVFGENPKWVEVRSNERMKQRWLEDHPGYTEVPASWLNALTNVKSDFKRRRKGRVKPTEEAEVRSVAPPRVPVKQLLELEEKIDACLLQARTLGGEPLDRIADLLRKARNAVIKMSE